MATVADEGRGGRRRPATSEAPVGVPPSPTGGGQVERRPLPGSETGWWPLAVLVAVVFVDQIDSRILIGVLPALQEEWGFSDSVGGAIPLAVAVAALFAALPAGYLADRYRRTSLLALVVVVWSVLSVGSAVATSFAMFFVIRMALGFAEDFQGPLASSLLADYYPPKRRARAFGVHGAGVYIASPLGVLFGGVVASAFGWRAAFLAVVVPALGIAWLVHRLPEPARAAGQRRKDGMDGVAGVGTGLRSFGEQIRRILSVPTVWKVLIGTGVMFFGGWGFNYWLPTLFVRTRGFTTGEAAATAAGIMIFGAVAGVAVGAWAGDRWHGRIRGFRPLLGGLGQVVAALGVVAALQASTVTAQVVGLALANAASSVGIPTITAATADVLPRADRGSGFGVAQLIGVTGAASGPLVAGVLSDAFGSLTTALQVTMVALALGGLVIAAAASTYDGDRMRLGNV